MSGSNCCSLSCTQASQEADKVVWYYHLIKNIPQFAVTHVVKGFSIVNEAEVDVFLEFLCFFYDLAYVGNLISDSSAAADAKSLQSCPTLCDPIDGGPPGSPVPGILQARTLEWVAIFFSNAWKWKVKAKSFSRVRLFATPWTAAYQAPPLPFLNPAYTSGIVSSSTAKA